MIRIVRCAIPNRATLPRGEEERCGRFRLADDPVAQPVSGVLKRQSKLMDGMEIAQKTHKSALKVWVGTVRGMSVRGMGEGNGN